jgi:hypothetical protein
MINIQQIVELHRDLVVRWHQQPIDCPYDGFLGLVCRQASFNFLLWHEEDIARSPDLGDARIAQAKRAIDNYNQQRNDWIEKIDDWIAERLAALGVVVSADAPQNTETLGSTIDRLSILALRIYHLQEHSPSTAGMLRLALQQLADLSRAAQQLADDLASGRKRHGTYRALKMYNDPMLNPHLRQAAGAEGVMP